MYDEREAALTEKSLVWHSFSLGKLNLLQIFFSECKVFLQEEGVMRSLKA